MTIRFTEEEQKYIEMKMFDWQIADNCPEDIRKTLEEKLAMFKKEEREDG